MIVVDIDSASLARLRFVPSPAQELVSWLRLTVQGRRHPVYGDPGAAARSALFDRDVALTAHLLTSDGYVPDLLTPKPPAGGAVTLERQLEVVAETPVEEVVSQCHAHRDPTEQLPPKVLAAAEKGVLARRAARALRIFWRAAVDDSWTTLRSMMEADIDRRARTLARKGAGNLLNSLHPSLRWRDGHLEILKPYDVRTQLTNTDVVLAPSALGWPNLAVQLIDPADSVICYPATEIGSQPVRDAAGDGVGALVGSSRARLLSHLRDPCSTTELSARTGLSPATVSHHLSVLLRSGLLVRQRHGRKVLYRRTERGDSLVSLGAP